MRTRRIIGPVLIAGFVCLGLLTPGCNLQQGEKKPRMTLFIGVDASGSFYNSEDYEDSLSFLAHYIYGHMNGLDGLEVPRELFVASIGGSGQDEPKAFHPYHDFKGKEVDQIEADLREWFPPKDRYTDFNAFFRQVARITKERNLVLAPITIMVVTDGVPDFAVVTERTDSTDVYKQIDFSSLEYLARRVTLRLTYVSPRVGDNWRTYVPRRRVRLWTVDAEVMRGWNEQRDFNATSASQHRLWEWIQDNVDFRVRARAI